MNNGTSSSSSDYKTTPKFKKSLEENINAKFDIFTKTRCDLIMEDDNKLFKNRTQEPTFVLSSFQKLLYSKLDRLSLQQVECELDRTDHTDKYNCFELGYCGHPNYPHTKIFSTKQVI